MKSPEIETIEAIDHKTPGEVYLCQVNDMISCGACCGLYNIDDPSEENLTEILTYRTELFEKTPRTENAIDNFAFKMLEKVSRHQPLNDFYHCPFLGYPNREKSVVGCLLHPMAYGNNGIEYRGYSYYGGLACKSFFCKTVYQLPADYKKILRTAAPNWYLYGLIITEYEMLKRLFEIIESRLQMSLNADRVIKNTRALEAIRWFYSLKSDWPFRREGSNLITGYVFGEHDGLWESIDYARLGYEPSIWTPVFHAFYSVFESADEIRSAEDRLNAIVEQFVFAISSQN